MLFRSNQDADLFNVDELFKEKSISQNLLTIEKPKALALKPSELYQRIKDIALWRYKYTLPENQTDLKCLQSSNYKISLLRDLSLKLGLKILNSSSKDFILENDEGILLNKLV